MLKSRIEQPVRITVVWHSGEPSGNPKVNGNFLNGLFPFVFLCGLCFKDRQCTILVKQNRKLNLFGVLIRARFFLQVIQRDFS